MIAEGTDDSPSIVETSADDDASATPVLGDEEPMTEAPSAEDSGSDISETAVDGSSQPQAQAEAEAEAEAGTAEPELDVQSPADETVEEIVSRADEADAVTSAVDEPDATDAAASASDTEAIRIRGLVKSFGDHTAVDGIDLTVPAGSFYGIVGPNGAGKTTTLSIVAGLLRADRGEIVICGIDQRAKPLAAKRMMGVLPDRLRTFDRLTGRQLLHYYGLLRGLASGVIEKRVGDLARAFDLGDALNRVVSDYSAGMTKKIMLAGAMIHSPRVLVLDEPFEAVDPVSSAVILDILRAYVAHGGTVILSSHGMDLVERVCSRVAIIVGGEVLAEGTIDEVRAGQTLEARFVELSGGAGEVEGLEWLHTFSD
ncbi:ABC transporter ATP-binding protein [uncultured Microbacterium sp.]|uniref:ABC transporter ATP-binding protein n=1 Tax=uncultured Microbacterium sp. TaxID=191216 RepID=UPI0037DD31D9